MVVILNARLPRFFLQRVGFSKQFNSSSAARNPN